MNNEQLVSNLLQSKQRENDLISGLSYYEPEILLHIQKKVINNKFHIPKSLAMSSGVDCKDDNILFLTAVKLVNGNLARRDLIEKSIDSYISKFLDFDVCYLSNLFEVASLKNQTLEPELILEAALILSDGVQKSLIIYEKYDKDPDVFRLAKNIYDMYYVTISNIQTHCPENLPIATSCWQKETDLLFKSNIKLKI